MENAEMSGRGETWADDDDDASLSWIRQSNSKTNKCNINESETEHSTSCKGRYETTKVV